MYETNDPFQNIQPLGQTPVDWEGMVNEHPLTAILVAAAAGAGIVALMSLTGEREPVRESARDASREGSREARRAMARARAEADDARDAAGHYADRFASATSRARDSAHDFADRAASGAASARAAASDYAGTASKEMSALRDQLADMAKRLFAKTPDEGDLRKQAAHAGDALRDTWQDMRDQAADLAKRLRPQVADLAGKVRPQIDAASTIAKENPLWVGIALGGIAALLASRVIGSADR